MVLAYHFILSAYGFWLPNDPRGSWSDFVRSWELFRYGPATKVTTTRSVAHKPHDTALRLAAKQALKHPPTVFTGRQALAVAHGFAEAAQQGNYRIHACAILPEHVHLIVGRHERHISKISAHLKGRATHALKIEGLWPHDERPVWGRKYWAPFIDTREWLANAIQYVEDNPMKEGLPRQRWSFVVPAPL